ncbi:hypothetical protein BDV93DRAFT_608728 [Ceratobasidium sp. AG-I]|nr:hypothetical protein BDV93DRAFT_608728 [Ceratobasidium sp. AG-I]
MLLALLPKQPPIRELVLRQNKFMGGRLAGLSQTEWDRLLEPLRVLYFDRVNIRSYKVSCRNLVELYLISPSNFSTGRFAQILESNPGLRTIVLSQPVFDIRRARPTAPINLPSVRYVQLPSCQRAIRRLFEFLVPGPHALDLHLGAITDPADFTNTMIPFFQRANVKSLYLHGYKIYLLPILTALPHLQILGLSKFKFDASTFAGLESAVNLLPKLHTINLNECNFDDYSELCPGLRVLLSLPSVRQIKHLNCRYRQKDSVWKDGIQPSEGSGFNATIIQASVSDFETHASPFR